MPDPAVRPLPSALPPRVFLTGMMGCGKTAAGPLVAAILGYVFVDLDREVERRTGRPVADLFERGGEAAFRAAEAGALAEAAVRPRVVVATGGGALVEAKNLALARAAGAVVYLRVPPDVLAARLTGRTDRPLLLDADGRALSGDALVDRLAAVLAEREAGYRGAHATVEAAGGPPRAVAKAVVAALGRLRL